MAKPSAWKRQDPGREIRHRREIKTAVAETHSVMRLAHGMDVVRRPQLHIDRPIGLRGPLAEIQPTHDVLLRGHPQRFAHLLAQVLPRQRHAEVRVRFQPVRTFDAPIVAVRTAFGRRRRALVGAAGVARIERAHIREPGLVRNRSLEHLTRVSW